MSLARLSRGYVIAVVAALGLLVAMAADWYSTGEGEEARRIERLAEPEGGEGPEALDRSREQQEEASLLAESEERNAWQAADGGIDLLLLVLLLAAVAAALASAVLRARGRGHDSPGAAAGAVLTLSLVALGVLVYRLIEQPGIDSVTTVRGGAFLGMAALGAMGLGALMALRADEEG